MSLTKEARNALPDDDFAVPGKRKLPIHDATHIRLAWDMVDRTAGLTEDERRDARERIIRRAHEMGVETKNWNLEASFRFEAMALDVPAIDGHPNRMPFSGIMTRIGLPSDNPTKGSDGHRVVITREAAEAAIPSLLGMAIDCDPDGKFDGHDATFKIGLITGAELATVETADDAIRIEGFFYANDFPTICDRIQTEKHRLGFSYECKARIRDLKAEIWVVDSCVFTGAALLYKDDAAYTTTSLAAQTANTEITEMELKDIMDAIAGIKTGVEALNKDVADLKAKGASLGGAIIDQVRPHVEALNAAADAMEKDGIGTHAENGHVRHLRHMAACLAAEAVSGRVPHVYRDHDYLSDAKIEAAKGGNAVDLKPITDAIASLSTQLTDLKAKAFNEAQPPERKTVSPEIVTLLAKAGIKADDVDKLDVHTLDKTLEAAGIKGRDAMTAKMKLMDAGMLSARG